MDRFQKLEKLASSLNTVSRVANIYKKRTDSDARSDEQQNKADILHEMLGAVSDHAPDARDSSFGKNVEKCGEFCNTYRNLKNHFKNVRNKKPGHQEYAKTLSIVKPAMGDKSRTAVEKFLKIYEILNS